MSYNDDASALEDFILNRMRMKHIYQPVMLKVLLEANGTATLDEIAKALLSYDLPQIKYYRLRTKKMVGDVLTKNGVVEPIRSGKPIVGYRLVRDDLSEAKRTALSALCDEKLAKFVERNGGAAWSHRSLSAGYISGSTRYEVLKRAKYRCDVNFH